MAVWTPRGQTPQVRLDLRQDAAYFVGSLHLRTGDALVTRSDRMNSDATIAHLEAILKAYPDQLMLLFWGRAPWHTSAAVQACLQRAWRMEVVPFSVGAPDLNPHEHGWKLVCRAVEHHHDHTQIGALADAVAHERQSRQFSSSFFEKDGGSVVCPIFV